MMKKLLFILLAVFVVYSCTDDSAEPIVNAKDYYPLSIGSWYEYKLDSIIYDDFDNSVTLKEWSLLVEIDDVITDGEGEELTRVVRKLRPRNSNTAYQIESIWFVKQSSNRIESIEENLRFIKLLSPIVEGKTWEGNRFIDPEGNDNPNASTRFYQDWDYAYQSVNESMTIGNTTFENVVHVNQSDDFGGPGTINHFISNEYYAKDIGLIKKRMEIVVENCGVPNCSEKELPILERTSGRKGFILDMELTNYNVAD